MLPDFYEAVLFCTCGQVIPFSRGSAWEQPPPDLASYLYKNRIVYLGMSLVPSVTELILAEFLYLQYDDAEKPIYLYVNSTGTTKVRTFYLFSLLTIETFIGYVSCTYTADRGGTYHINRLTRSLIQSLILPRKRLPFGVFCSNYYK